MSRWCDHVACTKDLLDWFLWAVDQDEPHYAVAEITDHVYQHRGRILRHDSNHVWEGVHRVLTGDDSDDLDFDAGDYPLRLAVHGGEWLLGGPRTMSLVKANELPDLVAALDEIDQPWVVEQLLALQELSPGDADAEVYAEADRTWHELDALRKFYHKANAARLPVICTISH
jgi:hypothetical protein